MMVIDMVKAGLDQNGGENGKKNNSNEDNFNNVDYENDINKDLDYDNNLNIASYDHNQNSNPEKNKLAYFEIFIETIFKQFSNTLKFIGPIFSICFFIFTIFVSHSFFKILIPYWKDRLGIVPAIIIILFGLYLVFNIIFNYSLAVLVKPGCVDDIKRSKFYKRFRILQKQNDDIQLNINKENEINSIKSTYSISNPYIFSAQVQNEIDYKILLSDLKELPTKSNNDTQNVPIYSASHPQPYKFKLCKPCNMLKPLRAHHCHICGHCVFKMDHHCPWINNCVGQNNHRYFVLFLTYTMIGCYVFSLLCIPIFFFKSNKNVDLPKEFNFICILAMAGSIILLFFNTWNWFLVLNGNTTIEYWSLKGGAVNEYVISDFSLDTIMENLYMTFGTKSLLKAIFIPSIKRLPYSGLEWSRLCDKEFKLDYLDDYEGIDSNDSCEDLEDILISGTGSDVININKNMSIVDHDLINEM